MSYSAMERFAFKIDDALRTKLYNICRLCGIDNPGRVPIIKEDEVNAIDADGEPVLREKIKNIIGFTVTKSDRMPQTICMLCVDKINDIFEFREMCFATNAQTRNLLGLKPEEPIKTPQIDVKPMVNEQARLTGAKRGRKRKSDDTLNNSKSDIKFDTDTSYLKKDAATPMTKKKRLLEAKKQQKSKTEIKVEPDDPRVESALKTQTKKYRKTCVICSERFANKEELEEHQCAEHVPNVPRYICNACDQTHYTSNDIRSHHLWHKLSKTPYKCGLCKQLVANNYAFTRHLREHAYVVPLELQVFDRECPQCKATYATNFLYNTHICALKTRKCGGCSRQLRGDYDYLRHAPFCAKIYLSYSKHIPGEVMETESQVSIKNESDIDAATEEEAASMQPFVSLERLSSPMMRTANPPECNSTDMAVKKISKKDSKKNYLKRMDKLLKSTLDTLVSIKHEPEVQVDADDAASDSNADTAFNNDDDDYQLASNNSSEYEEETMQATSGVQQAVEANMLRIKKEIVDDAYNESSNTKVPVTLQIKEEPKPFALKIKITKEHGQLNSSLVDEDEESLQHDRKKKKKKKKDNEKLRNKEHEATRNALPNYAPTNSEDLPPRVQIKQEPVDEAYNYVGYGYAQTQPHEAAVMTSIPITQFQITCLNNNEGIDSTHTELAVDAELPDIKPNRMELDQLFQITHVASGADVATPVNNVTPPMNMRATARKSTGGGENAVVCSAEFGSLNSTKRINEPAVAHTTVQVARVASNEGDSNSEMTANAKEPATAAETNHLVKESGSPSQTRHISQEYASMPQIVSVQSGLNMHFDANVAHVIIKQEPCNRGYSDETHSEQEPIDNEELPAEDNTPSKNEVDEATYIASLDFTQLNIKQEKDLEVYDMQLGGEEPLPTSTSFNGVNDVRKKDEPAPTDSSEDDDDESDCSDDEAAARSAVPLTAHKQLESHNDAFVLKEQRPLGLVITSVCGQAEITMAANETANRSLIEGITESATTTDPASTVATEATTTTSTSAVVASEVDVEKTVPVPALSEVSSASEDVASMSTAAPVSSNAGDETLAEKVINVTLEYAPAVGGESNIAVDKKLSAAAEPVTEDDAQTSSGLTTEALPAPPSEAEHLTATISGTVEETNDLKVQALPVLDTTPTTTLTTNVSNNSATDTALVDFEEEEQQNVLNHELSAQQTAVTSTLNRTSPEDAGCCAPAEETENRINEQQQQQQYAQQRQLNFVNDSNINEIAENNNNANIERELLDETNTVATTTTTTTSSTTTTSTATNESNSAADDA